MGDEICWNQIDIEQITNRPTTHVRKASQSIYVWKSWHIIPETINYRKSSLQGVLRKDLRSQLYKIQLPQELKATGTVDTLYFVSEMFDRFETFENCFFSDEANFHLNVMSIIRTTITAMMQTLNVSMKDHCTLLKWLFGLLCRRIE